MNDKVKRYALYLLVMAGLGGLLYGIDVGVIAAALPYIENTASYTKTQIGFVVGMVLWGSVISSLFAGQLQLDDNGYIMADESTETNIPGVFAVGDIRTKALRQIITAAADGANAAHHAEEYLASLN